MQETTDEIRNLKTCINNLISIVTLPAIWVTGEIPRIVSVLVDVLLNVLQLDCVYVRLTASTTLPLEIIRSLQPNDNSVLEDLVKEVMGQSLHSETWPLTIRRAVNTGMISIAAYRLGLNNEMGVLVACSRRTDFPDATERLLLNVAANQATVGLREAHLLSEQRRLAGELDQKVTQRTQELEDRGAEIKKLRDELYKENVALREEIENRKRADEALQRTQFYLSEGQRLAHMGSWAYNPSGFFEYWSSELFQIYGLDPQKGPPSLDQYLATIHPQDRDSMAATIAHMREQGRGCDEKKRIVRPNGELRYIRYVGIPVLENGALKGFLGTAMDVTEQELLTQELQRRAAYLAEAQRISHTGSFGWRVASGEIFWSDETFRIFGFERNTKPMVRLVLQRTHPGDRKLVEELITRASREAKDFELEHRILLPDGSVKNLYVMARAFFDEMGETEYVGAVMDITAARQARTALETALHEIESLKDQLYEENIALRQEIDKASSFEEIIGASINLQTVLSRVSKVAPTNSTVLITGETGTGKELVARAIHKRSDRAAHPFVSVNCAAIPRDLVASELFGHEKGAFTGASQRRPGRFELAEGGTIFLDEVGELPSETQVALLRVLQGHEFERVGGTQSLKANVRVIAATNRDLHAAIASGIFRRDLFYRLNVFPIDVPPLRERSEDIPVLVEYFIDRYARNLGRKIRGIEKKTLDLLQSYSWPGNIRELQNVIERSVIVCEGEVFSVDASWLTRRAGANDLGESLGLFDELSLQEKGLIESALQKSRGRVYGPSGAAAMLRVPRSTLESKIRSLGISKNRFKVQR